MLGRQWHRERGKLDNIRPGEKRYFSIEIGVAEDNALERLLAELGHPPVACDVAKL
jgi:hypothetical protein|eukprot:COSAG02_NODE_902_length_16052_cov_55.614743_3_plen_56_part_00